MIQSMLKYSKLYLEIKLDSLSIKEIVIFSIFSFQLLPKYYGSHWKTLFESIAQLLVEYLWSLAQFATEAV